MHRTHGDGYNDEGGYNRFIDQALPTIPGTVDTAEYNNAVQEEICNVIEMTGGTLNGGGNNGDPAADRAAGWHQLYDTIFQGGHITDAAIDEISFSKVDGIINKTVAPNQWYQSIVTLIYQDTSTGEQLTVDAGEINLARGAPNQTSITPDESIHANDGYEMRLAGRGIRYGDGPGEAGFQTGYYRKALYGLSSIPWAAFLDTNGDNTGIYVSYQDYATDIPDYVPASTFIGAWLQYLDGSNIKIVPATVVFKTSGGFVVVDEISISAGKNSASPNPSANLILEFDAQTLT